MATDLSQYSIAGVISPSGGIACLFSEEPHAAVRCDVHNSEWHLRTPPRCHEAYGDSVSLANGRASLDCHGDTVFGAPNQPTLPYGQTAGYHGLTCTSATTGMTCRDATGHGFSVSREAYRLF